MTGKKRWGCQVDKKTAEIYKQYFREGDESIGYVVLD